MSTVGIIFGPLQPYTLLHPQFTMTLRNFLTVLPFFFPVFHSSILSFFPLASPRLFPTIAHLVLGSWPMDHLHIHSLVVAPDYATRYKGAKLVMLVNLPYRTGIPSAYQRWRLLIVFLLYPCHRE